MKHDTLTYFNINRKIEVIPNFIDFEHYQNRFDERLRNSIAPNNEAVLTHVSNFRKVKRVEDVVRVFHLVKQQTPAKLAGDGPERLKIEQLCRKLNLSDDIKFLGKSKAIEKLMTISDLFLLPSEAESFGLVALEAMASGVPVISSNVGGLSEVNKEGITGFLSEVGNLDEMAANALKILQGDLKNFKKNARTHAQSFDLPKILPQYERLYESMI